MTSPEYVNLRVPVDTIEQTVDKVVLAIMADPDNDGIAHYLVVNTDDLGCYKLKLTDDATASLLAQCVAHNDLGERLLREQEGQ